MEGHGNEDASASVPYSIRSANLIELSKKRKRITFSPIYSVPPFFQSTITWYLDPSTGVMGVFCPKGKMLQLLCYNDKGQLGAG